MPFDQLGLSEPVLQGIAAAGYTEPTAIQLRSIPVVLEGRDLIASAQTGTGKTAAFALPVLSRLKAHGGCRCLVLEPTRELAAQVETAFRDYARFTDFKVALLHGGVGYFHQIKALKEGADIIVATPGRLEDHLQKRTFNLNSIEILVLDEVDRMLDIGFLPIVRRIVSKCPKKRQTLLFSATVPSQIAELASWSLHNPVKVEIGVNRSVSSTITHALYPVSSLQKFELLLALLEATDYDSVLIFTRTKRGADHIANSLRKANHSVAILHANRSQRERMEALAGFKSGKYEVMVATDIASRGIDISGISHVINYDVPEHPEDYVHRIGRTGRAQTVGDAFTLVTRDQDSHIQRIERFIGKTIERVTLPGFQYNSPPIPAAQKPVASSGVRRSFNYGKKPRRFFR